MQDIKIIDEPERRSLLRKAVEFFVTANFWAVLLYLLVPVFTLLLWLISVETGYDAFFFHEQATKGLIEILLEMGLVTGISFIVMRGWAYYNLKRFGKKDRRKHLVLGEKENQMLAEIHQVDPALLQQLQSEKEVVWTANIAEIIPVQPWLEQKHYDLFEAPKKETEVECGSDEAESDKVAVETVEKEPSTSMLVIITIAIMYFLAGIIVFIDYELTVYFPDEQTLRKITYKSASVDKPIVKLQEKQKEVNSDKTHHEISPQSNVDSTVAKSEVTIPSISDSQQSIAEVGDALEQWRKAWMSQNIKLYFSSYSKEFKGGKHFRNRDAWIRHKQRTIQNKTYINITLEAVKITIKNKNTIQVACKQSFQSNSYHSHDSKILWFKNIHGEWKIVREDSRPIK